MKNNFTLFINKQYKNFKKSRKEDKDKKFVNNKIIPKLVLEN